jgi:hypothetical protein
VYKNQKKTKKKTKFFMITNASGDSWKESGSVNS